MRDPAVVIEEQRARAAKNQAAYKARKDAQHAQNVEAVKTLFMIIKGLMTTPGFTISDDEAAFLNEVAKRV